MVKYVFLLGIREQSKDALSYYFYSTLYNFYLIVLANTINKT